VGHWPSAHRAGRDGSRPGPITRRFPGSTPGPAMGSSVSAPVLPSYVRFLPGRRQVRGKWHLPRRVPRSAPRSTFSPSWQSPSGRYLPRPYTPPSKQVTAPTRTASRCWSATTPAPSATPTRPVRCGHHPRSTGSVTRCRHRGHPASRGRPDVARRQHETSPSRRLRRCLPRPDPRHRRPMVPTHRTRADPRRLRVR